MRVLELGTQRGEMLELHCKAIWPDAEVQVPLKIPWPGGFMEGTCDLWIPSLRTIVDFKTAGAYTMGLLLAGEKEDEGYALQLNGYRHGVLHRLGWSQAPKIPCDWKGPDGIRTILVYEAKDSDARKGVTAGMLVEQEISYTEELETRYQFRLTALHALIEDHKRGALNPFSVPSMPRDSKGNPHWKCKLSKTGRPLYCSIGPINGQCG